MHSLKNQGLVTVKVSILSGWSQRFQALFNTDRTAQSQQSLRSHNNQRKQKWVTQQETTKTTKQLKTGRVAGGDKIPSDFWSHGAPFYLHSTLHELCVCHWGQSSLPQDLDGTVTTALYKNKGEKSDCSNYQRTSLVSIAGKVSARMLLTEKTEAAIAESQCGLRGNRRATDIMFVIRQLQEDCREQKRRLYVAFIDLTKTFDTVSRERLWQIMNDLAVPQASSPWSSNPTKVNRGQVRYGDNFSESFAIATDVKQGCGSHQLLSLRSSAWCSRMPWKTSATKTAATFGIALMAIYSTWDVHRPTQRAWGNCFKNCYFYLLLLRPLFPTLREQLREQSAG